MPKFINCTFNSHGKEVMTWVNLDFVRSITQGPERILSGQDAAGGAVYREGETVLYVNVSDDRTAYMVKDQKQMKEVLDFLQSPSL